MKREDLTEKLLDIKREKGWSWKHICEKIGGYSEVLITGAILGQMKLTKPQAANAGELFGLSKSEIAMLNEVPMRGTGTPMPPTDPLIYRFYELVMVNGPAWKALIEEEYGDGIMSAIALGAGFLFWRLVIFQSARVAPRTCRSCSEDTALCPFDLG